MRILNSIKEFFYITIYGIYYIFSYLLFILNTKVIPTTGNELQKAIDGSFQMLSLPLEYAKITKIPNALNLSKLVIKNTGQFIITSIIYESLIKPNAYKSDNKVINSLVDLIAKIILFIYLLRVVIYSSIHNITASNIIPTENKDNSTNECKCDQKSKIKASISSSFYNTGNTIFINLASMTPAIGPYINFLLNSLFNSYMLADSQLGPICRKHLLDFRKENFSVLLGFGVTLKVMEKYLQQLILQATGTKNIFGLETAINCLLTSHLIMFVQTRNIKNNYPSKNNDFSVNIFYPSETIANDIVKKINMRLIKLAEQNDFSILNHIKNIKINDNIVFIKTRNIILGKDFSTAKRFITTPSVKLLIKIKEKELLQILNLLSEAIKYDDKFKVSLLVQYLPSFFVPKYAKNIINNILASDSKKTIQEQIAYLKYLIKFSLEHGEKLDQTMIQQNGIKYKNFSEAQIINDYCKKENIISQEISTMQTPTENIVSSTNSQQATSSMDNIEKSSNNEQILHNETNNCQAKKIRITPLYNITNKKNSFYKNRKLVDIYSKDNTQNSKNEIADVANVNNVQKNIQKLYPIVKDYF